MATSANHSKQKVTNGQITVLSNDWFIMKELWLGNITKTIRICCIRAIPYKVENGYGLHDVASYGAVCSGNWPLRSTCWFLTLGALSHYSLKGSCPQENAIMLVYIWLILSERIHPHWSQTSGVRCKLQVLVSKSTLTCTSSLNRSAIKTFAHITLTPFYAVLTITLSCSFIAWGTWVYSTVRVTAAGWNIDL